MPKAIVNTLFAIGALVLAVSGIADGFEIEFFGGAFTTGATTFFIVFAIATAIAAVFAFVQAAARR